MNTTKRLMRVLRNVLENADDAEARELRRALLVWHQRWTDGEKMERESPTLAHLLNAINEGCQREEEPPMEVIDPCADCGTLFQAHFKRDASRCMRCSTARRRRAPALTMPAPKLPTTDVDDPDFVRPMGLSAPPDHSCPLNALEVHCSTCAGKGGRGSRVCTLCLAPVEDGRR